MTFFFVEFLIIFFFCCFFLGTQKSGLMNTRGTAVKKDKELFDKQKLQNKESQKMKQTEKKNSMVRIKAEPVLEPVEIDVDFDESFSSEQTSPSSSVRSLDQKPNSSYNEDKSRLSSSNSPSLPPQERKPNSYISVSVAYHSLIYLLIFFFDSI